MYLLSQFIYKTSKDAVIYSGEGSDEASGSYLYFHNAPNIEAFKMEIIRLLAELCYFDCKRCDEATACAGLEVRVPFLDIEFLDYYMNIDSQLKMPSEDRAEKHLLRSSFSGMDLIPDEVLWRTKEAMSDGVSSMKRGWFEIIQDHAEKKYSNEEFIELQKKYTWHPPQTKEALYFREIFNEFYPNRDETIPYTWLPKWSGDIVDPSARVLDVYDEQNGLKEQELELESDSMVQ
jgi:asparagine synthase (glutamine-hydrolysing)